MKQKLLSGLAMVVALIGAPAAFGQPTTYWDNWGSIMCPPEIPPMIDALHFANHGQFIYNITNYPPSLPSVSSIAPFQTFDTLTFSNDYGAFLACNSGFLMQYNPSQYGVSKPATSFYNAGTINCGTLDMTNLNWLTIRGNTFYTNPAPAVFTLGATNIVGPGIVNMGPESVLSFTGDNIDLTRGVISVQNAQTNTLYDQPAFVGGIFDGYWGVGTNFFNPGTNFASSAPRTFPHNVTNRQYVTFNQILVASNAPTYFQQDITFGGSNIFNRVVFLSNTNSGFPAQCFFPTSWGYPNFDNPNARPDIVVRWTAPVTNVDGLVSSNYLYLFDSYGIDIAGQFIPYAALWPWVVPAGQGQTFVPINFLPFNPTYQVLNSGFFFFNLSAYAFFIVNSPIDFGPAAIPAPPLNNVFFNAFSVANYAAYEGIFSPGSVLLNDVAGRSVTNLPGRVNLTANKQLDLTRAQITSVNTVTLKATNHFVGSMGARIATPYADINLRSTNGTMIITNLIEPVIPHPGGICDLCSIRWTNLVQIGPGAYITNGYHVVFVNAQLAPRVAPLVQSLTLRSTNALTHDDSIVFNDFMTVTTNLLLDTRRLTIATNDSKAMVPFGGINLVGVNILWSTATPRLQYLTNYGLIEAANAVFFGGSRSSPYYTSNYNEPYYSFVNRGAVTNFSSLIWATNFCNTGTFYSSGGAIQLQQARNAVLKDGAFFAPLNQVRIESSSLLVSNHTLWAGAALSLWVTNSLDDGSLTNSVDVVTNKNIWNAGFGFSVPMLPPKASLLATTVTNTAAANVNSINTWAALDYGPDPSGFVNNAAVGHLILDGKTGNSVFTFVGPGAKNALYIDLLELKDATATTFDGVGNFVGVSLPANFNIYYGGAVWNGKDISEQINGRYAANGTAGGRFLWVSNYNTGFFSSTNVTYTDGSGTHRLNRALVQSCDIDSNNDGTPNCMDPNPIPVFSAAFLALKAVYTNTPGRAVVVSWNTLPLASNYLYAASSPLGATNRWQLVTNFRSSATSGPRVTVTDMLGTNKVRYYRAQVIAH